MPWLGLLFWRHNWVESDAVAAHDWWWGLFDRDQVRYGIAVKLSFAHA